MSEWIPISETPAPVYREVVFGWWFHMPDLDDACWWETSTEEVECATHWCELPNPPAIVRDRDGTRSAETACPAPVPKDCQARAEGIAQTPDNTELNP